MFRPFITVAASLMLTVSLFAQSPQENPRIFLENLAQHCGNAYVGRITSSPAPADFEGKELIMHVISCEEGQVKIPFYVGEDLSRTWIFTLKDNHIELKHDHRLEDGTPDAETFYGGITNNTGFPDFQVFPADQETTDLIPAAASNVWWVSISENTYTYNLKRIGREGEFNVTFDLSTPIQTDKKPWGTK